MTKLDLEALRPSFIMFKRNHNKKLYSYNIQYSIPWKIHHTLFFCISNYYKKCTYSKREQKISSKKILVGIKDALFSWERKTEINVSPDYWVITWGITVNNKLRVNFTSAKSKYVLYSIPGDIHSHVFLSGMRCALLCKLKRLRRILKRFDI